MSIPKLSGSVPIETDEDGFKFGSSTSVNPNKYPIGIIAVFLMFLAVQTTTFIIVMFNMYIGMYDESCFGSKCSLPFYKQLLEEPERVHNDDSNHETTKQE